MLKKENLLESISYQAGTIVSRTIVNQPSGTVTLFAFDKEQSLSEHVAPFDALVYLLDGRADIKISGKINRLLAGEMIIMPANQPHSLKAREQFKMLLIMIKAKIK